VVALTGETLAEGTFDSFTDASGTPYASMAALKTATFAFFVKAPDGGAQIDAQNAITLEPTGFRYPASVVEQYDSVARTLTIVSGSEAYWRGQRIAELVDGWVSEPHPEAVANYFLYYNGTDLVWSTSPWNFTMLMITYVSKHGFAIRENHGLMQHLSHEELHNVIGTYRSSGGDLSGFLLGSTVIAARSPSISACTLNDEDIPTTLATLPDDGPYTVRSLTGATSVAFTVDSVEILPVTVADPFYNQFTGGNWVQTIFPNNAYGAVFVMAVPVTDDAGSQAYRFQFIQPQTVSGTLSNIQALTPNSLNWGEEANLTPEFSIIAKIIVQRSGGSWRLTSVESIRGTNQQTVTSTGSFLSSVATAGIALAGNGTGATPLQAVYVDGYEDYNDSATNITPLSVTANTPIIVPCDGLGVNTQLTYKPFGVARLYDPTTNSLDLTGLAVGDEVMIQVDIEVSPLANNARVRLYLDFENVGFTRNIGSVTYYKGTTPEQMSETSHFYIGYPEVLAEPVKVMIWSDVDCSVVVRGFYISVKRRF
jgi:hypothetical protein